MIRVAALPWAAWWMVPLAVAIAFLGWETDWGRALAPVPEPAEPIVAKPVPVSVLPDFTVAGGLAARPETVARTLFNPTRRPAPPVVAEAPKPTMKRGQFTLTGTLVVDGKSTAFLREVAGGKARRVLQGESINGLVVAEVKPDRVRLTMGDESEELILKVQTNPKPTAVAAAPPPVGAAGARPAGSRGRRTARRGRRASRRAAGNRPTTGQHGLEPGRATPGGPRSRCRRRRFGEPAGCDSACSAGGPLGRCQRRPEQLDGDRTAVPGTKRPAAMNCLAQCTSRVMVGRLRAQYMDQTR